MIWKTLLQGLRGRSRPVRWVRGLVICGVLAGCAQDSIPKLPSWSLFPETPAYKTMYGPTPAEEMEQFRALAEQAAKMESVEAARWATQLSNRLPRENDELIREQLVRTLALLPGENSKEAIRRGLTDPSPAVRRVAIDAWSERGGDAALPALAEALARDTDMGVRLQAARALARVKHTDTPRVLAGFLEDRSPGIQLAAMESLREMTGKEMPDDVSAWKAYVASTYGPAVMPKSDVDTGASQMLAEPDDEKNTFR